MKSLPVSAILRILIIYAAASGLWIFLSDRLLAFLFQDTDILTRIQTYKGWLFVLVSCVLLFSLLKREQIRQNKIEHALNISQQSSLVLFSSNPIPMMVYDAENFDILAVNDAALELYGYSREEFSHLTFDQIILAGERLPGNQGQALSAEATNDIQHHRSASGQVLTVKIISHAMEFNRRNGRLVAIQDVTDRARIEKAFQTSEIGRIQAETSLQLDESRLEALNRLFQFSGSAVNETAGMVLGEAAHLTGSEYAFLAILEGSNLNILLSTPEAGNFASYRVDCQDIPAGCPIQEVLNSQKPTRQDNTAQLLPGILPLSSANFQIAIPVIESGRVTALAAAVGRSQPFADADVRQLALLGGGLWRMIQQARTVVELQESRSRLASAVENLPFDFWIQDQEGRFVLQNQPSREAWGELLGKKLDDDSLDRGVVTVWKSALEKAASGRLVRAEIVYPDRPEKGTYYNIVAPIRDGEQIRGTLGMNISIAALKQRERELDALVSIAATTRAITSQSEMRSTVLNQVMSLLEVEAAALVSQDQEAGDLQVDFGTGFWADRTGKRACQVDEQALSIFTQGVTHWSPRIAEDVVMAGCSLFSEMTSGACIPLKTGDSTHFALWVGSLHTLTESQVHLLEAIADILGNAIHRAQLSEQTERHLKRMTALRAIDLAITSSLDVRLTLNILLSQISSQLNIDAADVLLFSPHTRQLEHAASRGFATEVVKSIHFQLGESYAGTSALERKQIILKDIKASDPHFYDELRNAGEVFTGYLVQPLAAKGQVKGVLEIFQRGKLNPSQDWLNFLDAVSAQAAIAIDNAELFDTLQRTNTDLTVAYDATIEGWSRALELRDRETQGHTQRVTQITLRLAELMGIKDEYLVNIRRGVLLHDIGKMAIPDRILLKPGPLTAEEWEIMRKHPQFAHDMLSPIPYLRAAIDIPYSHHERWDGSGYPRGIRGNQIPLAARLFAVVDIWDALTSDRPYRHAWTREKVSRYLRSQAGKRLDPEIVDFFIDHIDDL